MCNELEKALEGVGVFLLLIHSIHQSVDSELMDRIFLALLLMGYHMGQGSMSILLSSPMTFGHVDGLLEALGQALAEQDK